ncbi:MAG: hypothetical protein R6X27_08125 [Candidatus Desulfacyla sp.]
MVDASTKEYFQALREINIALTKGLQTVVTVLENPERFTDEQRQFIIDKMNELIEGSEKVYGTDATKH